MSRVQLGAFAWIAGPVQFVIAQVVVQFSWHTRYSWTANAISDLGAVRCGRISSVGMPAQYVCSPLHGVMNLSTVALAALVAVGVLLNGAAWGGGAASLAARGLILVAAAGDALVGFAAEDVHPHLHLLGAFAAVGAGNAALILAGLIRRTSPLARLSPLTVPLGVVSMVATWLTFTHCTPIVGSGGMERIAVFPLLYWLLVAGVSLLPKAGPGPLRPAASGAPRRPPRPAVTRRAGYGTWRAGRGKFVANRCSVFWMERSGVALTFAQQPIRVLGVDPGLTRCGLGVVDGAPGRALTLVRVGVVRTPADDGIAHRLLAIETEIEQWLDACQPNAVAVERVFSQSNVQTVMGTAQAGAVAIVCAARRGIPVALHTPTEVKAAVTGSGRADKDQVTSMVTRLLRLTERPKPADAADALALAICHIWRGGTASRLAAAAARVTTGGAGAGSAATRSPATRSPAPRSAGR